MPAELRTPPPGAPLPALLRLPPHRSVFRLGPGARMLGLDPAAALAVDHLPPALAELLDELAGPFEPAAFVARAASRGVDAATAQGLLGRLVDAGALLDAAGLACRRRHRAESTVVVAGEGPLAVGVVVGLVQAGVGAVHTDTAGPVLASDVGTGLVDADRGHDRLVATRAAVRRLRPEADAPAPPRRLVPDLVVLADALAPDPARLAGLHAAGTAHLPARLRDGVGVVGPLVLPGRTACLGCLELHRTARDPGWPAVAAQLVGQRGRADPAATAATAALATEQALVALDGTVSGSARPPTLDTTIELDVTAATITRRTWTPQPGCPCGARGRPGPAVGFATGARRARSTDQGGESQGE